MLELRILSEPVFLEGDIEINKKPILWDLFYFILILILINRSLHA